MEIFTTSQVTANNGVKILTYGDSGLGKTLMCATAPSPFVGSAESGLLSLRKKNIEKVHGVNTPGITYDLPGMHITKLDDVYELYRWFSGAAEAKVYETICLDSLSEIGEVCLHNAKKSYKDPRQAYGELITQMEELIRAFRDLPGRHVYMTAKMEPVKNELTGVVTFVPSMPGAKLGPKLPYFFDEMFRLAIGKDQSGKEYRYLQTQPDLQYGAKDRSGALDAVEFPSLTSVINKIIGA